MTRELSFRRTETCSECPWLRDVEPDRFPPERFVQLRRSVEQGFAPMFACHKTLDTNPTACVGFLLRGGDNNFHVRMALIRQAYDPRKLRATGPLYDDFDEMAIANGADPGDR
jgi:hypothetical protein